MIACKKSFPLLLLLFSFFYSNLLAQNNSPLLSEDPEAQQQWVDSIYGQMTLEQKVGQLFMVDIFSNQPKSQTDKIKELIEQYHIGGVIFSKGGPQRQAKLTNEYQELSKVPLLIGMDAEWGLAMRLDSTYAFPWNMALGAVRDTRLIEETGAAIAQHSRRLGVHVNFAPVVDINTNPDNPIIGNRSFGEEEENVTDKAVAIFRGMDRGNLLTTAKHFPGHGDTSTDSHKALPVVDFPRHRLDSVELYPYRKLIDEGLTGIMVGHLSVPTLDNRSDFPASLSEPIVTGILKEELNFKGLIFTDALAMKGATIEGAGNNSLAAFLAGNDVLLMPKDLPKSILAIKNAYEKEVISEERLKHSVQKILYAKYKVGLHDFKPVNKFYLNEDLNSVRDEALKERLVENALTVVKNNKAILPVKDLDQKRIAYLQFGDADGNPFFEQLNKYTQVDKVEAEHLNELLDKLKAYNLVVVGFHKSDASPYASHEFTNKELVWLYEIARTNNIILNIFTSPYALLEIESNTNFEGIVVNYQNGKVFQEKAAQLIFGGLPAKGRLPVKAGSNFPAGTGFGTEDINRLSYGLPETVGMNSFKLQKIDSVIDRIIEEKMSPGVQVLVARKGKVIYNRSAGYHTYKKENPVKDNDIYDVASLTKIVGTLPLVIELVDQDELDLDTKLSEMLPEFKTSNKKETNLRQMLSHYARLKPWIPFHRYTFDDITKKPSSEYYRSEEVMGFDTKVAEGVFIRNDIRDSIIRIIGDSELQKRQEYRYSDLPFYLLKRYLERRYGASLADLTQDRFYKSLGATNTTYLPLYKFPKERIVPTAEDDTWRNQLLHGNVHDEGAALLGGIGGHAGIFSNANDIAKIMQMYLNGGHYGGKTYFQKETFDKFNTCYYCQSDVRRGVGFDKPQLSSAGPTCGCVSMQSFGHSGFTGTFTWADPNEEIVYVFLSNRIHPSVDNNKLTRESVRSKIQELIYEAIDY